MLSSVLNSERAIEVNILIMWAFVKLRKMIASHKDLSRRQCQRAKGRLCCPVSGNSKKIDNPSGQLFFWKNFFWASFLYPFSPALLR
jgi:hypothetical protein